MDKQGTEEIIEDEIEVVEDELEEGNEEEVEEDSEEDELEASEEEEDEEPMVIIERDGVEYEVPERLKSEFMQSKDYTQKTQKLSEERRALEEAKVQFEEERKRDEEDFKLQAQVHSLDDQLSKYENVDWTQLEQTDPEAANSHWRQFQMLKDRKTDLNQKVTQRQTERSQAAELARANRIEEANKFAADNGWSKELANEIQEYALSQGWTQESLMTNLSPALLKSLHDGLEGQKIKSKVAKPAKKKVKVKPLRTVKAKSGTQTTRVNLAEAPMADYYKARQRGVGG